MRDFYWEPTASEQNRLTELKSKCVAIVVSHWSLIAYWSSSGVGNPAAMQSWDQPEAICCLVSLVFTTLGYGLQYPTMDIAYVFWLQSGKTAILPHKYKLQCYSCSVKCGNVRVTLSASAGKTERGSQTKYLDLKMFRLEKKWWSKPDWLSSFILNSLILAQLSFTPYFVLRRLRSVGEL